MIKELSPQNHEDILKKLLYLLADNPKDYTLYREIQSLYKRLGYVDSNYYIQVTVNEKVAVNKFINFYTIGIDRDGNRIERGAYIMTTELCLEDLRSKGDSYYLRVYNPSFIDGFCQVTVIGREIRPLLIDAKRLLENINFEEDTPREFKESNP